MKPMVYKLLYVATTAQKHKDSCIEWKIKRKVYNFYSRIYMNIIRQVPLNVWLEVNDEKRKS